jgi:hypothetical protein
MATSVIQTSFSAGEISPSLWGRVDLAKYAAGCATLRNFIVDYKGGATARHGTEFIGQCRVSDKPVRMVPFQFSVLQTYALEFGEFYMRVIKDEAYVLEDPVTITGITQANPGVVTAVAHGFTAGDWVYLEDITGMTELNTRTLVVGATTPDTFQLYDTFGNLFDTSGLTAYSAGGQVSRYYTLVSPYAAEDLALIKWTQSADVMTITHPNYPVYDLTRTDHDAWTFSQVSFASTISAPASVSVATSGAGTSTYMYQVTAVDVNGQESVASADGRVSSAVDITATAGTNTVTWSAVAGASYYNVYRAPVARSSTDVPRGSETGFIGTAFGTQFVDSNISPDFTNSPPRQRNPFAPGQVTAITITAGGAGYVASTTTATVFGTGSGASVIPIVVSGAVVAAMILNGGQNYAPGATISFGGAGAGAAGTVTVGPQSGTYPSTTTYFQQRKWYAGPTNFPETLYASKPGAYKNFDRSVPTVDDDSLELTLASLQVNNIKWMIPMPGGLVVLSGGGAWQISGGDQNAPVTPTTAQATAQAYNGCSDVPPIVINYDVLYVQSKGSIVRDLAYNFFANIYTGTDLSILSNHLFDPRRITEWAWAEEPHKIIWAVRDDGILLSLTFLKEQEVYGWARHDTQGSFRSVCTITEGQIDATYFVVERYINGETVKFVERFACRSFPNATELPAGSNTQVEESFHVDAGLQTDFVYPAARVTLSGITGTITVTANAAVFGSGDVGKAWRGGNAIGTVVSYISTTQITVDLIYDVTDVIPDTSSPFPLEEGEWSLTPKFSTIGGLWHLEGQTVKILGDGNVFPDQVVTNGEITVNRECSKFIIGLGYQCQLQTLDLEIGEPTGQGKFKKLAGLTVKVQNARGWKYGPTFDNLYEVKQRGPSVPMGTPIPLVTGQEYVTMAPSWNVEGRICIQQDYPLPVTVLAVVPEVVLGSDRG